MPGIDNGPPEVGMPPVSADRALHPTEPKGNGLTPVQERLLRTPNGPTGYAAWVVNFDQATNGLDFESMKGEATEIAQRGRHFAQVLKVISDTASREDESQRYRFPSYISESDQRKIYEALEARGFSGSYLRRSNPDSIMEDLS